MALERKNASFNIRDLTFFLDGGSDITEHREKIMLEFERDPTFQMTDIHDLTRPELRERYMTRVLLNMTRNNFLVAKYCQIYIDRVCKRLSITPQYSGHYRSRILDSYRGSLWTVSEYNHESRHARAS